MRVGRGEEAERARPKKGGLCLGSTKVASEQATKQSSNQASDDLVPMAAFFTFLNRCPIGNRSGRNRLVSPANATVERESLEKERGPFVSRRRQSRIRWDDCALEQADKRVGGYSE